MTSVCILLYPKSKSDWMSMFLTHYPRMEGRSYIKFFNFLIVGLDMPVDKIRIILAGMTPKNLMKFLSFIHKYLAQNSSKDDEYSGVWKHFELILSCSPILTVAEFLLSIDKKCRVKLLKACGKKIASLIISSHQNAKKMKII